MHTIDEKTEGQRRRLSVTMLVRHRWTTWTLVLWSGYMAVWAAASGAGSAIVFGWWLSGLVLLQAIRAQRGTTAGNEQRPG